MFQGNWKCSKCGGAITELPFEPRSESGLTCRECYFKEKDGGSGGAAQPTSTNGNGNTEIDTGTSGDMDDRDIPPFDPDAGGVAGEPAPEDPEMATAPAAVPGEKPKFSGDWKCAGCGSAITSLPFMPRSTENLKCIDCFKASKA